MDRRTLLFFLLTLAAMSTSRPSSARAAGEPMLEAANLFLKELTDDQRHTAQLPFDDEERYHWHYVPMARKGLPLKQMSEAQRKQAMGLLHAGLSQKGFLKATTIISLENILRDIEQGSGPTRDPELYYFTVFGAPSEKEPWGWRVEGHHVSLNFTVIEGSLIATTPQFLGANPAEVKAGPRKGLRALPGEEDLGRALVKSLDDKQRAVAVIDVKAPSDIITGASRKAEIGAPKGIPHKAMTAAQQAKLMALLEEYARNMPEALAKGRMDRLKKAGLDTIHFAWAGGLERGEPHYYRVQGRTFLIEYDNTQNNANHIHSVWRDFDGDWGEDLLRAHYDHSDHHDH
jgi:hypothetical protein